MIPSAVKGDFLSNGKILWNEKLFDHLIAVLIRGANLIIIPQCPSAALLRDCCLLVLVLSVVFFHQLSI